MILDLAALDVNTLMVSLFWGNLVSALFLIMYLYSKDRPTGNRHAKLLALAKLFHAAAYLCFINRGDIPDLLSVNLGNTIFFLGFYLEAIAMLRIMNSYSKRLNKLCLSILAVAAIGFNTIEFIIPKPGIRVMVASVCVLFIMMVPASVMLFGKETSRYAKITAVIDCFFMVMLLPRAWYSFMNQDVSILTNNLVQALTFLSLLLQLIFSIPSYILIVKQHSDDALIHMATTDKLTGVTNRHTFVGAANAIFQDAIRMKRPLSILFIDGDKFKNVNDKYGHLFGDTVLTTLANTIDKSLRESDLSCRYGGEEFVVLLRKADSSIARSVAERIVNEVRSVVFDEHKELQFTVSVGAYSGVPAKGQSIEDFIGKADEAMYKAKNSGRDQVVLVIGDANID